MGWLNPMKITTLSFCAAVICLIFWNRQIVGQTYASDSLFLGTAPHPDQIDDGTWMGVEGVPRHAIRLPDYSENPVHPRLFFGPEDLERIRARQDREPYASMVEAIRYGKDYYGGGNISYMVGYQARNAAFLYVLTGDPAYAEEARQLVERLRKQDWDPDEWGTNVAPTVYYSDAYWENPESYSRRIRHLSLTQGSLALAICYDWCYDAWPEAYREKISKELALQARVQLDEWGEGYPTKGRANNWRGIRFSGAGIALLASDEPHLSAEELDALAGQGMNPMSMNSPYSGVDPRWLQKSYELVASYLRAGLTTDASARGHNVEGWGYVLYPWRLIAPFLLALEKTAGLDMRNDIPAVGWNSQIIAMGAVPVPFGEGPVEGEYRLGWRPDLADDNAHYEIQGSMALSFPFMEEGRRAAMRWVYDRFEGMYGTGNYELGWAGATWGYLYYPEELAEVNPQEEWGLGLLDRPSGTVVMRNRYADDKDNVFAISARGRGVYSQTHYGADLGSLRILGEGGFFATGSGRTTLVDGQSTVMRIWDLNGKSNREAGELSAVQLLEDGSGAVTIKGSATGVSGLVRRVLVDYAVDAAGVSAFYVVADDSDDGDIWRLNTPGFNTVSIDGNEFTVVSPAGSRLVGTVQEPANAVLTTGTFDRRGTFYYEDMETGQNRWVEVRDPDGSNFVVTMQLLPAGEEEGAEVIPGGEEGFPEYSLGERSYTVTPERIFASDWPESHTVDVAVEPVEGGTVSGAERGIYVPGTNLELVAEAAEGYVFAGWESDAEPVGGPVGLESRYTLQVSRDIAARAHFVRAELDANGNGIANAVEAAVGLDPTERLDLRALYAVDRMDDGSLGISFRRKTGEGSPRYRVVESGDLGQWSAVYDSEEAAGGNTHFGRMRVSTSTPTAEQPRFLQLQVVPD